MQKIRVSAVSYLNTKPFLYGIDNSPLSNRIELTLANPSECARKLEANEADLALIPVAALLNISDAYIVSDFCIGATGKVKTVNLYSEVPVPEVSNVLLDYQSRTSVQLVKILADHLWKINPVWENTSNGFIRDIKGTKAGVVIGDRTFSLEREFPYVYDLAEEWNKLTGLPFVFAVWAANKDLPQNFLQAFNEALAFGVNHRHLAVEKWQSSAPPNADLHYYFDECISYRLDDRKRKAIELFRNLMIPK